MQASGLGRFDSTFPARVRRRARGATWPLFSGAPEAARSPAGTPENQRNLHLLGHTDEKDCNVMTCSSYRPILMLALCALTTGCITSAEQQAQRNEERCAARGYQPNTDAFKDCLVRLDTERELRMQTRRQEMLERSAVPSSNRGY
jgi:hypothetical protein